MSVYTLPDLPYDYGELEPHLIGQIVELHHDKHHAAYVAGANTTLEKLHDARQNGEFPTINQLEKSLAFHISGHKLHSILAKTKSFPYFCRSAVKVVLCHITLVELFAALY